MMDFIPEAQTLLIVVASVVSGMLYEASWHGWEEKQEEGESECGPGRGYNMTI